MRSFFRILLYTIVALFALGIALHFLIASPRIQQKILKKTTSYLSKELGTNIEVERIEFIPYGKLTLHDIQIPNPDNEEFINIQEASIATHYLRFRNRQIALDQINVKGALVNISREENDWNFAFLKTENKKDKKKSKNWWVNGGKINIKKLQLKVKDLQNPYQVKIESEKLIINLQKLDPENKLINIKNVDFDHTDVYVGLIHKKHQLPTPDDIVNDLAKSDLFNPDLWGINIQAINYKEGNFHLQFEERTYNDVLFDYQNIVIKDIDFNLRNINITGDTLKGKIHQLSAKERSGLSVKNLSSDVTITPKRILCDNIDLDTYYSRIYGFYAMNYQEFRDFLDYNNKVVMEAQFLKGTQIAWKDLNVFASELNSLNHNMTSLEGYAKGSTKHMVAKNAKVSDGFNHLTADVDIAGLPDPQAAVYTFSNMKAEANGMGLAYYAPSANLEDIKRNFHQINIEGDLAFSSKDLIYEGVVNTNKGSLEGLITLNQPYNVDKSSLGNSQLDFKNLDIHWLLNQNDPVLLTGNIDLKHSIVKNDHYQIEGIIQNADWQDIHLHNINYQVSGNFKDLNGKFDIKDEQLHTLSRVHYTKDKDGMKVYVNNDIQSIALHHWSKSFKEDANLQGIVDFSYVKGDNTTYIVSNLNQLSHSKTGKLYHDIQFFLDQEDKAQSIRIFSKDLVLNINGDWTLKEIKKLPKYYQKQILGTKESEDLANNSPHEIDLTASLLYKSTDQIFEDLLGIQLNRKQAAELTIQAEEDRSNLQLDSDGFKFNNITVNQLHSNNTVGKNQTNGNTSIKKISIGDTDWLDEVQLNIFEEENLKFHLTSKGEGLVKNLDIITELNGEFDDLRVKLLPSQFEVNEETWHFPNKNQAYHIAIKDQQFSFENIKFESEHQKITIQTNEEKKEHYVHLNDLNLNLINAFTKNSSLKIAGQISGVLNIKDVEKQLDQIEFDLQSDSISINDHYLSDLDTEGQIDFSKNKITLKSHNMRHKNGRLYVDGDFFWKGNQNNHLNIHLNNTPLDIVSPFMNSFLDKLSGQANGQILLTGSAKQPRWNGNVEINKATFRPIVTGGEYEIPYLLLKIRDNTWQFDPSIVKDQNDQVAIAEGTIKSNDWTDWHLDIVANAEQINLINLNANQNKYYYGNVNGKAFFSMKGPLSHLVFRVNTNPTEGSKLYIPVQDNSDLRSYSYIQFRTEENEEHIHEKTSKIDFYLQSTISPNLEVSLILDETLKEKITATGEGFIQVSSDAESPLKINGTYSIEQGYYDFVFRQLEILNFRKRFNIYPNSIIKWDGDPFNAHLDVKAYTIVQAKLYDLISSETDRMNLSNQEIRDAQIKQPILVNLEMDGPLKDPDLKFDLALEEGRSLGTLAHQKLLRINQDSRLLINQVASLLLLEQFIPNEGLSNAHIASGSINNMSEIVSSAASNQITNLANKILGMEDLSIGLKYKNYTFMDDDPISNLGNLNRNEAGIQLRKEFFKNRLLIEVGGSYDWGRTQQSEEFTTDFMGDFRVQYFITEDGKFRMNAFRNSQYDPLYGKSIARHGVSFAYKKSFKGLKSKKSNKEESKQEQDSSSFYHNINIDSLLLRKDTINITYEKY